MMSRRSFSLAFVLLASVSVARAQTPAAAPDAAPAPVSYGHHHLNVSSIDEQKKFWVDTLGAAAVKIGTNNADAIRVGNLLIFLRAQKPTAGSKGSTVDHFGFSVPNLQPLLDKLKAAGYRVATAAEAPAGSKVEGDIRVMGNGPLSGIAYVFGPDDLKVELMEMKAQTAPILPNHVHFFGDRNADMAAWYAKVFGAKTGRPTPDFIPANIPGTGMNFSPSPTATAPTQGRAIDHIGFEVKNLEAFTKQLEAQGIKITNGPRQVAALGLTVAFLTDPWGTYIELTEGIDKLTASR
jgi:catechol 2,3-dioxygenase-like lactoylglutathione lyase family enzyme